MTYELDFFFKGKRNYITGADIYQKSIELIKNKFELSIISKIGMFIHKECRNNFDVQILTNKKTHRHTGVACVFSFLCNEDQYTLVMQENDKCVSGRVEYPEEQILTACSVLDSERQISLDVHLPFTMIEIIVAMNKKLLERLYPDSTGRWLFTRLQLNEALKESFCDKVSLKMVHNLRNQLVKSLINVDQTEIGFIYFSPRIG